MSIDITAMIQKNLSKVREESHEDESPSPAFDQSRARFFLALIRGEFSHLNIQNQLKVIESLYNPWDYEMFRTFLDQEEKASTKVYAGAKQINRYFLNYHFSTDPQARKDLDLNQILKLYQSKLDPEQQPESWLNWLLRLITLSPQTPLEKALVFTAPFLLGIFFLWSLSHFNSSGEAPPFATPNDVQVISDGSIQETETLYFNEDELEIISPPPFEIFDIHPEEHRTRVDQIIAMIESLNITESEKMELKERLK